MNTRIKELMEQAKGWVFENRTDVWDDTDTYYELAMEKLAELIVGECDYLIQQQVSLKYKDGWEQCGLSDDWAGGHYGASILSRTVIKQHFGVEE
jgi:hypothetical protein